MQKTNAPASPGREDERNEATMQTEDVKPAYQAANALDSELDSLMLYFEFSNGDIEIVRLNSISRITYIAQSKAIAMHIPEGIIGLQGTNLDVLLNRLYQEKVRRLHAYNPEVHGQPADGDIVIESMQWVSDQHTNES
jgi:hypothetical protein